MDQQLLAAIRTLDSKLDFVLQRLDATQEAEWINSADVLPLPECLSGISATRRRRDHSWRCHPECRNGQAGSLQVPPQESPESVPQPRLNFSCCFS